MQIVENLLVERKIQYAFSGKDLVIKCLNPEHPDNNPSLRIDRISGIGHCFSCGFKLNIFKYFGIETSHVSILAAEIQNKIDKIYSASRGLDMPDGYSLYNSEYRGIPAHILNKYSAFTHKDFEDRIVFPLKDRQGSIRVFVGRSIYTDQGKRYIYKPAGISPPFFPHDYKPIHGDIILVEGIFDALNLMAHGFTNAIGVHGVTTISEKNYKEKISLLKLSGTTRILIMFDNDSAGNENAAELKSLIIRTGVPCDTIDLPRKNIDPGDLTKNELDDLKRVLGYENSSN